MKRRGLLQRVPEHYLLVRSIRSRQLLKVRMLSHRGFPELPAIQQTTTVVTSWGLPVSMQEVAPSIGLLLAPLPLEQAAGANGEPVEIVAPGEPAVIPIIKDWQRSLPALSEDAGKADASLGETSSTTNDSTVEQPETLEEVPSAFVSQAAYASEKSFSSEEVKEAPALEPPTRPASPTRSKGIRRSISRIEERPSVSGSSAPAAQPARERRRDQEKPAGSAGNKPSNAGMEEVTSADALFQPSENDRSPQVWLARLRGQKSPEQEQAETAGPNGSTGSASNTSPTPVKRPVVGQDLKGGDLVTPAQHRHDRMAKGKSVAQEPATKRVRQNVEPPENNQAGKGDPPREAMPLSQHARRFLRPLVGIDPAAVPIYRDTLAGQAAEALGANALTRGNYIELGAGLIEDTPQTLGLLAHELTHVTRQQEPRFIPPVARGTKVSAGRDAVGEERMAPTDEEALAERVEGRVRHRARREQDERNAHPVNESSRDEAGEAQTGTRRAIDPWGGLPAPWEPLPVSWLAAPTTQRREARSGATKAASHLTIPVMRLGGAMVGDGQAGEAQTDPTVQRAGIERSVPEEQEDTSAVHDALKAPEADLDALARQVYAILKRRLGVEYRRGS